MSKFEDILTDMECLTKRMENLQKMYSNKSDNPDEFELTIEIERPKESKQIKAGSEGVGKYTDFIKKINKKMFMIKFYGKGKRNAQSVLYELYKDLSTDGADRSVFKGFLTELNDMISADDSKTHTLTHVNNKVKEFRSSYNWNNPKLAVSRKV